VSIFDVKYQDRAIDLFQQALKSGRLSHAYIFAGPNGIGKSTTAREFAKLLLCEKPVENEPANSGPKILWRDSCGQCTTCRLVAAGNHPDIHMVYKELITLVPGKEAHKATELGIDVIRQEVIDKVGIKPSAASCKIFIVLEAQLMSRSAQNALLKTLEEPPANTYLFLISEQIGTLLPTIRSRSQTLMFQLLPEHYVVERLRQAGASERESDFFSRFMPGKLGGAMELFRLGVYDLNERLGKDLGALDLAGVDDFAQWLIDESKSLAEKMAKRETQDAGELPAKFSESELNRTAVKLMLALTGGFIRDSLRYKLGFPPETLLNKDRPAVIKALAEAHTVEALRSRVQDLNEAERFIDANVNVALTVTDVFNKIFTA